MFPVKSKSRNLFKIFVMENAYLYVRVSTDEQKRKGFSLMEQENRLLKFCVMNQIKVKAFTS